MPRAAARISVQGAVGIADSWIVNIPGRCVEVRRDPRAGTYRSVETYQPGQNVRPLAFPDAVLPLARVFST